MFDWYRRRSVSVQLIGVNAGWMFGSGSLGGDGDCQYRLSVVRLLESAAGSCRLKG